MRWDCCKIGAVAGQCRKTVKTVKKSIFVRSAPRSACASGFFLRDSDPRLQYWSACQFLGLRAVTNTGSYSVLTVSIVGCPSLVIRVAEPSLKYSVTAMETVFESVYQYESRTKSTNIVVADSKLLSKKRCGSSIEVRPLRK